MESPALSGHRAFSLAAFLPTMKRVHHSVSWGGAGPPQRRDICSPSFVERDLRGGGRQGEEGGGTLLTSRLETHRNGVIQEGWVGLLCGWERHAGLLTACWPWRRVVSGITLPVQGTMRPPHPPSGAALHLHRERKRPQGPTCVRDCVDSGLHRASVIAFFLSCLENPC